MTPLARRLIRRIRAEGPISVVDYMAACLLDPDHGYYATRDPFGASGDFVTAPEISQMFGELIGLALAQAWLDQGAPSPVALAELGPGRGTLMADAWRATARVPGFHEAASVVLVEASPTLRRAQAERVPHATWADSVADLPDAPLLLVANEFLDALPIRQFVRAGEGWAERQVGVGDDALAFGLAPPVAVPALAHRLADTPDGEVVELCPALPAIVAEVARRIGTHGGGAIWIDYGGWRSRGDTLQAVRAHAFTDPLAAPGEADLTAHVDFEAVADAARPHCAVAGPVPQGELLARLGIGPRAAALARTGGGGAVAAALERLTSPEQMGTLFQALALHPRHALPLPGFA